MGISFDNLEEMEEAHQQILESKTIHFAQSDPKVLYPLLLNFKRLIF